MKYRFIVLPEHLKLLGHTRFSPGESSYYPGGAMLSPKRPFGNSDYVSDMSKILGEEITPSKAFVLLKDWESLMEIVCRCASRGEIVRPGFWEYTVGETWVYLGEKIVYHGKPE